MITTADVGIEGNWNGISEDKNSGLDVSNYETAMDLNEHKRIVVEAATLFLKQGWPQVMANGAWEKLLVLKNACTKTNNLVILISKGIHQPLTNPHIQLAIDSLDYPDTLRFHLDLSADDKNYERAHSGGDMLFVWRGVQFTAVDRQHKAAWPPNATVTAKATNIRRRSITPEGLKQVQEKIKQFEAKEAQDKIDLANKALYNEITKAFATFTKSNFKTFKGANKGELLETLKSKGSAEIDGRKFSYNKRSKTVSFTS